jgi:predicted nucleic acid-binding protein
MRIVISDTSPLRYLVLIGEADLLHKLYKHISIPEAVARELQTEKTPEIVRKWIRDLPPWVEILPHNPVAESTTLSLDLHAGEREAILLALHIQADLLLMDDRAGVEEARKLGLAVTGTLGVLARAAEHGWVDLGKAVGQLQRTNFRIHPKVIRELLQS